VLTAMLTIGVVVDLAMIELVGVAAGGFVVPGYLALMLDRPKALAGMALAAGLAFFVINGLARGLHLYGTRRFGLTILVGLVVSTGLAGLDGELAGLQWAGLGYIVPGLIAHQFHRQGVVPTVLAMAVAAPLTRAVGLLALRSWP